MTTPLDKTAPIRRGEELDLPRLRAYLAAAIPGIDGDLVVEQFPSGHSNLTYLLRCGDRELVLRRPPFGSKVKSAHDMAREFTVLSHLHRVYPLVPEPLCLCDDVAVMDIQFYVMTRLKGTILRAGKPAGFAQSPAQTRACCEAFLDNLVRIHQIDWRAAGLEGLQKGDTGYCARQVQGWTKRYYGSQTDDLGAIEATIQWLNARIPVDVAAVLVHNDYKFDNIVLDPDDASKIVGVLDWEMATIGDPLMDLGTTLGYWAQPGDEDAVRLVQCFLSTEPGAMTRQELATRYAAATGYDTGNLRFYFVFALFKLAVIVQQIYYRYRQGLTKDERFAIMIEMTKLLGARALRIIEGAPF